MPKPSSKPRFKRALGARLLGAFAFAALMMACSPNFNWRELRLSPHPLLALLPCKPDHAVRPIALAGREASLTMAGCAAGQATFAISAIDVGDAKAIPEALAQWQLATAAGQKMSKAVTSPFAVPGAALGSLVVGQLAGNASSHAVYFSQGSVAYQAQVLGQPQAGGDGPSALSTQAVETFFGGLKVQP